MADHEEIEQKFDVDAGFARPDFGAAGVLRVLGDAAGEEVAATTPVVHHLSAMYFDTPDGRLAASKITLRRRTGGTDEGWHLKLPGSLAQSTAYSSRLEVQLPLAASGSLDVPKDLAARVAEVVGDLPLAPIANLDTERTVVSITTAGGRVLAEIADDAVTARRLAGFSSDGAAAETAHAGAPLRWREVEVEVPDVVPELQRATADLLFAAGARPAGHGSKLARLLDAGDS